MNINMKNNRRLVVKLIKELHCTIITLTDISRYRANIFLDDLIKLSYFVNATIRNVLATSVSNIERPFADITMIKFAVVTMVCLLGLKMIAAMPVADHHEGHEPQPIVPLAEKSLIEPLKAAESPVQSSVAAEPAAASQPVSQPAAEQTAVVNEPAVRSGESSEEVQPVEAKKDEPLQPDQSKAVLQEAQAQPKSSEEQLEKEEPKVLATAEAEKKQEQETLKEAASETKEIVQPVSQAQPSEVPAEKKVGFLSP